MTAALEEALSRAREGRAVAEADFIEELAIPSVSSLSENSPDERLSLDNFHRGTEMVIHLLQELSAT